MGKITAFDQITEMWEVCCEEYEALMFPGAKLGIHFMDPKVGAVPGHFMDPKVGVGPMYSRAVQFGIVHFMRVPIGRRSYPGLST